MELHPEDLGQRRAIALMRRRAEQMVQGRRRTPVVLSPDDAPRPLGFFGKLWTRGTGLSAPVAAAAVEASRPLTSGLAGGLTGGSFGYFIPGVIFMVTHQAAVVGDIFLMLGVVMSSLGLSIPGILMHRMAAKPISVSEIDALLAGEASAVPPLEITYLEAVKDALTHPIPDEAAPGIRAALRAMGEAIDRLPRQSLPPTDNIQLRAEAKNLLTQAAQEADPVVAASRQRQAEAVLRSADAGARTETMQRRVAALRDELTAQAQSLRLGLTAFQSGTGDLAGLTQLADAVRGVAAEANALSDARAEVEGAVTHYLPTTNDAEPALRLIQG